MKTNLKLKVFLSIVIEQPLLSAMITIFFSTVLIIVALMFFHQDNFFILMAQISKASFWTIFILGVVHFTTTKIFITRFSRKKNRIPLLYYGERARIYKRPIYRKVPYVEIFFPYNWDLAYTISEHRTPLFIRVDTTDHETFFLYFNLKVETFGEFKAQDLEKLIALQKAKFPNRKRFELIDCLEDFLIADCSRNHHSIKFLLNDYHAQQISLKDLEKGIIQMIKIPNLFTNVKKMELQLSEVQRVVVLNKIVRMSSFNKAAAAVL
jgi:hypothetical protein